MALIPCPACNAKISPNAAACPSCGEPPKRTGLRTGQYLYGAIVLAGIGFVSPIGGSIALTISIFVVAAALLLAGIASIGK